MKKQKGFTLIELIIVISFFSFGVSWIWNTVKLASCDFEPNYKCEAIHGVGVVIPPLSIVTVWYGDDGA